ncbi:hypothetical protein [Fodinicola acaciae]|uniref:hypothetical protein n=1 Tax=Fodinicola acaciae TaxID=2681555 RepID=UPI0013D2C312|nr:hypothetical protein [Fodinicola acaciae]
MTRRKLGIAAAAVVALAVVIAGFVMAVRPAAVVADTAVPVHGSVVTKQIQPPARSYPCMFFPVTDKLVFHLFFLGGPCDVDDDGLHYAVTADGGRTWRYYQAPGQRGSCVGIRPLGPHDALMCDYVTHDDGRSWSRRPGAATVDAVPPGWLVWPSIGDNAVLTAINPHTGQEAQLAGRGGIGMVTDDQAPILAPDGSLWLVERTTPNGGTARISPDRGRSWRPVLLPAPFQRTPVESLITTDGYVGYAMTRDGLTGLAIFRSSDGGRSWTTVRRHVTDSLSDLLPGPGGSVVSNANGRPVISTDGCRTFQPIPGAIGSLSRTKLGEYVLGDGDFRQVSVSGPSLTFTTINAPL